MDKNTVIGFILIGLVLMIWLWISTPPSPQMTHYTDSLLAEKTVRHIDTTYEIEKKQSIKLTPIDTLGKYFSHLSKGDKIGRAHV